MKPWITLASAAAPGGSTMHLVQRDTTFVIRVGHAELMSSHQHGSEEELAARALEGIGDDAHVLVGGLGMGFTLRATLDRLGPRGRVDVVELVPEIVDWNRGPLAHLARRPLEDSRVRVIVNDVTRVIADARGSYHAILLDVDNGPAALSAPGNANLYGEPALARARIALVPGGMFAVWSAGESQAFTSRLKRVGFDARTWHTRARGDKGPRHVLWLARNVARPTEASAPRTASPGARAEGRLSGPRRGRDR